MKHLSPHCGYVYHNSACRKNNTGSGGSRPLFILRRFYVRIMPQDHSLDVRKRRVSMAYGSAQRNVPGRHWESSTSARETDGSICGLASNSQEHRQEL